MMRPLLGGGQVGPRTLARKLTPHPLYRLYRKRKVARARSGYSPRIVEHSYAGYPLSVRLPDPLAEGWYDRDWDEPYEISFLRERGVLKPGAVVFDLGAHHGVVALMLARTVGDGGRVIAVEAEPGNAEAAVENARLNGAANMIVLQSAASNTTEPLLFAEGLNGQVDASTALGNTKVSAVTVDTLADSHGEPDLVFIDVEGYEERVLEGAARALRNGRTAFLVEVHEALAEFGGDPASILRLLSGFGLFTSSGEEPYAPLGDALPAGRFFLIAIPTR
jgi:FkbM family methyltransferase